ncbi:MAG: hypothetical protein ACI9OJ_003225 [Myxococcota bacterium]|jgi:hypothetical protein
MTGERRLLAVGWGGAATAVFLPWLTVRGGDEVLIHGWAIAPGRAVLLTAIVTVAIMWLRRKKGRPPIEPLFSSAVLFALGLWALIEVRRQGVAAGLGLMMVFGSAGIIGVGALWGALRRSWPSSGETRLRIAVLWKGTILRERTFDREQTITIGTEPGVTFIVPDDCGVQSVVPLLKAGLRGSMLRLPPDSFGRICIEGHETTVAKAREKHSNMIGDATEIPLSLGDWGLLHAGPISVFFQQIVPARRVAAVVAPDGNVWASAATSTVMHMAMILCALFLWEEDEDVARRAPPFRQMGLEVTYVEEMEELKEEKDEVAGTQGREDDDHFGASKTMDEFPDLERGRTGPISVGLRPPLPGKGVPDPKDIGILALLQVGPNSGAVSQVLGGADALGDRIKTAMGLVGGDGPYAGGGTRLGPRGPGRGNGPGGNGMLSVGEIRTGTGIRTTLKKKSKTKVGRVKFRQGKSVGGCAKANISSVVRRRSRQFRYCFEQALVSRPSLTGPMTVRWTIKMDGTPSNISSRHQLGSQMGSCVARVIRRMRFARPTGATCVVQWPFVFDGGVR